jgi:hypothetical protein
VTAQCVVTCIVVFLFSLHVSHYLSLSRFLLSLVIDHFRAHRSGRVVILLPPIQSSSYYCQRELYVCECECLVIFGVRVLLSYIVHPHTIFICSLCHIYIYESRFILSYCY